MGGGTLHYTTVQEDWKRDTTTTFGTEREGGREEGDKPFSPESSITTTQACSANGIIITLIGYTHTKKKKANLLLHKAFAHHETSSNLLANGEVYSLVQSFHSLRVV